MKLILMLSASLNVLFIFMHEFDAFHEGEWKMFEFLLFFKEKTQYFIFLYCHIPLSAFLFFYLWTVYSFVNFPLWIIVNTLGVIHLIVHFFARKWESNVFKSFSSFAFIIGAGFTGAINLALSFYYL